MNQKIVIGFSTVFCISFFLVSLNPITAHIVNTNNSTELANINKESWWWTDLELITEDNTGNSADEKATVDEEDNIHVCWRDNTDYDGCGVDVDIFYRIFSAATDSWSAVEVVSTESTGNSFYPAIAVDSSRNIHVAWYDNTDLLGCGIDADIFYKVKDGSTGIWSDTEIVSPSSTDNSYYPEIAVDSMGNAHVIWEDRHDYDGTDIDIIYKVRDASSETWSALTVISSESTDTSTNPVIVVDNSDNIHVSWNDLSSGMYGSGTDRDVFYKKWDPIHSWSDGFTISYESSDDSFYPYLASDDTDSIYVVWIDTTDIYGAGSDYDVFYRKWDSSSQTWALLEVISTESTSTSTNAAVVIDSDSVPHFVWIDSSQIANSGIDEDIYYRSFDIGAGSLSDIVLLSGLSEDHSYTPVICKDSKDHLHVFMREYDPLLGSGTDGDIFYRKFVGPPESPILAAFNPNTRTLGNLTLNWSPANGADEYKIFRSTSYIWDVAGLTPIDTSTSNTFIDNLDSIGTFFYTIVASSNYGDSGHSNIESIEIIGSTSSGLFDSINWGEILILGGFLGVLQIVFVIVIVATKSATKSSSKRIKGKKK